MCSYIEDDRAVCSSRINVQKHMCKHVDDNMAVISSRITVQDHMCSNIDSDTAVVSPRIIVQASELMESADAEEHQKLLQLLDFTHQLPTMLTCYATHTKKSAVACWCQQSLFHCPNDQLPTQLSRCSTKQVPL